MRQFWIIISTRKHLTDFKTGWWSWQPPDTDHTWRIYRCATGACIYSPFYSLFTLRLLEWTEYKSPGGGVGSWGDVRWWRQTHVSRLDPSDTPPQHATCQHLHSNLWRAAHSKTSTPPSTTTLGKPKFRYIFHILHDYIVCSLYGTFAVQSYIHVLV